MCTPCIHTLLYSLPYLLQPELHTLALIEQHSDIADTVFVFRYLNCLANFLGNDIGRDLMTSITTDSDCRLK